jgi:hypothetical protein
MMRELPEGLFIIILPFACTPTKIPVANIMFATGMYIRSSVFPVYQSYA